MDRIVGPRFVRECRGFGHRSEIDYLQRRRCRGCPFLMNKLSHYDDAGNIHHPDVSGVVIMRQFIHKKRTSATSPSLKVVNFGTMTKASAFANETRSDDPIHGSGTAINLPSAELASRAGK